jgi:hypothetical protein
LYPSKQNITIDWISSWRIIKERDVQSLKHSSGSF